MIKKRIARIGRLPWVAVLFLCIGCNGGALPRIVPPTALPTTPGSTPSAPTTARLAVTYFFSTETVYEKIEIRDRRLIYTTFVDKEERCAQSMIQAPCWREEDLTTREVRLSADEEQALGDLLAQGGFWELDDTYGAMQPGQRFYPHRLSAHLGAREKEVVYQSAPDAAPMPTTLRQVMDQLDALVNAKFH
jgi:hypothetical protein